MCMIEDADSSCEVYRTSTRRSRKERRCGECGRTVSPGEKYRNTFMVYDHSPETYITCEHCIEAEDWLVVHCRGFLFGAVEEDIANHLRYGPWSEDENRQCIVVDLPARLVVGMRRKWLRFDKSGLMPVPRVAGDSC